MTNSESAEHGAMEPTATDSALRDAVHAANRASHDDVAEQHDRNVAYIHRPKTRRYLWGLIEAQIARRKVDLAGAAVLELGCGTGTFCDLCLVRGARSYQGIDLSPRMIEVARRKTSSPLASFDVASLEEFATRHAGAYDVVLSSSFLHHLVDLHAGVDLIRSMLRPGGVYVAVHETVFPRPVTLIEQLDNSLQYLLGYGCQERPLWQRSIRILFGHAWRDSRGATNPLPHRPLKLAKAVMQRVRNIWNPPPANSTVDLVDYLLNSDFRLSDKQIENAEAIPYCYLAFVELMRLSKPLNFEMLVLHGPPRDGDGPRP